MVAIAVLTAVAVLIAVLVGLCSTGRIPRNSLAGLRLPSLFASDRAWMVGHHAAVPPTAAAAVIVAVIGGITLVIPTFEPAAIPIMLLVFLAGLIVASVLANRAARSTEHNAQ